ncbi:helix-turn-helix transcriptional regulator [Aeromicrobium sp.]|uniref:helix-turn-helix domain-containing protein n=1 Tax=Aeromicrobium sp. TaxID=1871063 RepID=UPI0030EEBCB3
MARPSRLKPSEVAADWPTIPSDDYPTEVARQLALNLDAALKGISLRAAKGKTGVDHTTIADIINGNVWPDLHTIARLEDGLDVGLWPHKA